MPVRIPLQDAADAGAHTAGLGGGAHGIRESGQIIIFPFEFDSTAELG